ncbi:hypothetical protein EYF80_018482 [Liparis tanakae]|uniref:Uncharacterized protein n=1 Tax=Liparis tanakae TaxID=230148 RepID=A0A4Z2I0F7_9TELE|nr:hypothetical protein EYF80_018482 [Liparis tanakae]
MEVLKMSRALFSHGTEGSNLLFLRGMNHHHRGAQNAQQTADLPVNIQPLVQKDETGTDEGAGAHGQGETDVEVQTVHLHLK